MDSSHSWKSCILNSWAINSLRYCVYWGNSIEMKFFRCTELGIFRPIPLKNIFDRIRIVVGQLLEQLQCRKNAVKTKIMKRKTTVLTGTFNINITGCSKCFFYITWSPFCIYISTGKNERIKISQELLNFIVIPDSIPA